MDPLESLRTLQIVQDRVVSDRLASLLSAAHNHAAAERVLANIAVDTMGEKETLESVVNDWARARGEEVPVTPAEHLSFPDMLVSLLEVKRSAARRYRRAAESAPDADIRKRLQSLGSQAAEHAAILLGLLADLDVPEPPPGPRARNSPR